MCCGPSARRDIVAPLWPCLAPRRMPARQLPTGHHQRRCGPCGVVTPPPPHTHALLCPKLRGLAEHLAGEMAEQHIEGRTVTLKLKGTSFEVGRGMVGMRQGLTLAAQRLSFSHHCGQPAPALLVLRPDPSSGCPPPRVATGAHARRDARTLHLVGRRYAAAPHQAAAGAARSPFLPAHLPRAFARPGRVYARAHTSTAES